VGAVAARRMRRPPAARVAPPVLCIGNPTVGGSGKTPVAMAVAAALKAAGAAPVFLTRGYRGRLPGPVVVAGHGAADVGDEALLLAAVAPTVVARDRAAGGRLAATLGDVVVMDDGFQNPGLARTWSALVLDAATGVGNGRVTPAGPLRAPLAAHAPLADALVVVDAGDEASRPVPPALRDLPRYTARLVPHVRRSLAGEAVLAFAGIGRPHKFFAALEALGARLAETRAFPDHHVFTDAEASALQAQADRRGLALATTAKDLARLSTGSRAARALAARCVVIDVSARLCPDLVAAVEAAGGRAGGHPPGRGA
jgi:tetraacyldisaccharide 4'-kinase